MSKKKTIFQIYCILLFALMPFIITPNLNEIFYDGKIVFTVVITVLASVILIRRFTLITLLMVGIVFMSTILSIDPDLSIWGTATCKEGLIVIVINLIVLNIFYQNFKYSKITCELIIISSCIIGLMSILNFIRVLPIVYNISEISTLGNRNFLGTYCTLFIPIVIGFMVKYKAKRGILYLGILFGTLIASMTRAAWIAIGISVSVFVVAIIYNLYKNEKFKELKKVSVEVIFYFAVSVCLIISFINFTNTKNIKNYNFTKRIVSIFVDAKNFDNDNAGSGRVLYWKRIKTYMFDYPILGSGPDTLGKIYKSKYGKELTAYPKAHNEYLQMAVTLGYPYLLIYLVLVGGILFRLFKKAICGDVLSLALMCSILGYVVQAFFNISVIATSPIYWGLLGIGANVGDIKQQLTNKNQLKQQTTKQDSLHSTICQ